MKKDSVRDFAIGSKWLERELNKTKENPLHSAKIFKKKALKAFIWTLIFSLWLKLKLDLSSRYASDCCLDWNLSKRSTHYRKLLSWF